MAREALRRQEVESTGCSMVDETTDMARMIGLSRVIEAGETRDNGKQNDQSPETVAIGDAWRPNADDTQGDERLLDVAEVADRLHVSQSLVYKMIERREIPAVKIGRCLRVDPRVLEEILRSPNWAR